MCQVQANQGLQNMHAEKNPKKPRYRDAGKLFIPVMAALLFLLSLSSTTQPGFAEPSAPPTAIVALGPVGAHSDSLVRGSITYVDPSGLPEGASTYRWLRNNTQVAAGIIPQTLLLPLDGSLSSTDGQQPLDKSSNLPFVPGRYGQSLQTSRAAQSRLAYSAAGRVDPNEGSLEMWVQLSHDLDDPAYDNFPRLFSYVIDGEHQLYVEINDHRIILSNRNQGKYYMTWADQPHWRAGEWHHVAATWSSSAQRLNLYYDCVQAAEGLSFPALNGSAELFYLGSKGAWGEAPDASFDDVRLSRRALSAAEIAASCSKSAPFSNDELIWTSGPLKVGDALTLEVTPCNKSNTCGNSSRSSLTIAPPPLGPITPSSALLPPGTVATSVSLTTTAPADCRWSDQPGTTYAAMTHDFQAGQGSTAHGSRVDLKGLETLRLNVRCQDLVAGPSGAPRDPDGYNRTTNLRTLGPWNGNFPRIANLWGKYTPLQGVPFFSRYDLYVSLSWDQAGSQAAAIRAANPNAKILITQNATYGVPGADPLTDAWIQSQPGSPAYNCLLRDSAGRILSVAYWGHPMYNMTVGYCRTIMAQQSVDNFLSEQATQGNALSYDGIYWDRLHDNISWLGADIDSNLDGTPDDPHALDAVYQAGVQDFLAQVRTRLPTALLMGNEASQVYAPWINGRLYEWNLQSILDGRDVTSWEQVLQDYLDWTKQGYPPHVTVIQNAPEQLYSNKYTFKHLDQIPPAMEAEASASYQRMRFGLATALMGDGLFSYDWGADQHGSTWWYDEYGALAGSAPSSLPRPGYLGQPTGKAAQLEGALDRVPDQVRNGSFEQGLADWESWVVRESGAAASFSIDKGGGISGTDAARIDVTTKATRGSVEFRQKDIHTVGGQVYTLSFWARSSVTLTLDTAILQQTAPWTWYGFASQPKVTPQWQHFHLVGKALVTATDGKLAFMLGDVAATLQLDDVQLQEGVLGLWARPFSGGIAVVNNTLTAQSAPLPGTYCKLKGDQAPLFQERVDDDDAVAPSGWAATTANFSQFGPTVRRAPAGTPGTVVYTPDLAYGGEYEVLAWVAPAAGQTSTAAVTVQHNGGEAQLTLDETTGQPGWRSLGTYSFAAGSEGKVSLAATGNGLVVADAFKWQSVARYNDGSIVRQVTLQPQDGIVLLSSCVAANVTPRIYLPVNLKGH
jgi:hypothetical protein